MRRPLLLTVLVCLTLSAFCQTEPVNYRTAVNRLIHFYNQNQPDSIYNMFSASVKSKLPAAQNQTMIGQLQTTLGKFQSASFAKLDSGVATYNASFDKYNTTMKISVDNHDHLAGLFFSNYQPKTTAAPAADQAVAESPFSFKNLTATISGTLTLPKNVNKKVPVVLIIADTGPIDRDGNNSAGIHANTYQQLAYELAKNGIASLRYDKRITGQSTGTTNEKVLRFDDFIDDAVGLINQLHDDPRFSKVILFGHGEGSLVGMLAAVDEPANGFIAAEGAGIPADKIVTEQLKSQPDFIQKNFKAILDTMRKGKVNEQVDPALYSVVRPSIQPYLMTWFRHDPSREIKKVKVPVLILQGTNDLQVSTDNGEKLKKAKSEAQLVNITGMNHVLKQAPLPREQNIATYNNPELPLDPTLVKAVVDFVNRTK